MMIVWLAAFVIFAIFEAATIQLVSIWFAAGSLAALVITLFHGPLWLQFTVFLVVSIVVLALARPLIKRHLAARFRPTNIDRVMGAVCRVTEDIDNVAPSGAVSVQGKVWTARSKSGAPLKAGSLVRAVAIDGVKLIVIPVEEKKENTKQ